MPTRPPTTPPTTAGIGNAEGPESKTFALFISLLDQWIIRFFINTTLDISLFEEGHRNQTNVRDIKCNIGIPWFSAVTWLKKKKKTNPVKWGLQYITKYILRFEKENHK